MKANRLQGFLLALFLNAVFPLLAQQREADGKLLGGIRDKAEKGDAQSQFTLGRAFFFGNLGMAKDEAEATKWYRKAAEKNDADAQFTLGVCYENG